MWLIHLYIIFNAWNWQPTNHIKQLCSTIITFQLMNLWCGDLWSPWKFSPDNVCFQRRNPVPLEDLQSLLWRTEPPAAAQRGVYSYRSTCQWSEDSGFCPVPLSPISPSRKRTSWSLRACSIFFGDCGDQSGSRCRMTTSEFDRRPPPRLGTRVATWTVRG